MNCTNCGNQLLNETKFCGNCGEKNIVGIANQNTKEQKNNFNETEKIIHIIKDINNDSFTTSGGNGRWLIIFTSSSVFFVKTGWSSPIKFPVGILFGAVGGAVMGVGQHILSKINDKKIRLGLSEILSNAKKYYKFDIKQLDKIKIKKTWTRNTIFLNGVESHTVEIIVQKEEYNDFFNHIKDLYDYDIL